MESVIVESLIQTSNGINHALVEDLLTGKKVVSELSYEDSVILQDAMFEKLKTKYQSIYEGFSLNGELIPEVVTRDDKTTYENSPTNKINENKFFFNFEVAKWDNLFFSAKFDNRADTWEYTKEIPREMIVTEIHKPSVTKFDVRVRNGVDQGNAYGTKTDTVQRSYKVKSLKLIMERLEGFLDTFNKVADEKRPSYQKNIVDGKQEVLDNARRKAQTEFREIYYDYVAIEKIVAKYESDHSDVDNLIKQIIKKAHDELVKLKELGSVAWVDNGCTEAENYKDLGVFEK